ncbi:hypothetical protein Tco_0306458, partial [Tanacetum coccineum]
MTNVNLPFEDDQSPFLAYVVWIFLPFRTYLVTPWSGYSRKGTKRKPKANKSKHGVERAKSKVKPSKENTT